ncbi:hypothetical protein SADUNF_Sadunf04G0100100 [Salix dunnii]|uniref:Calponin-homology (CH) domain-containing protein n=1 Tax=Salix dunnii TaxID=1413687 RepID=A0A835KBE5_9ROSI|nr:hypothetical protein SADUNF_Sadunf04G0100100 [Salix dunnii]
MELGVIRDLQGQATAKSGASKQSSSFLKATTMTLFTISESEKASYFYQIYSYLGDHPFLKPFLPIDPATKSLFILVKDGVLLCKLINIVVPGRIDGWPVNIRSHGLGCTVVNIRTQDLVEGRVLLKWMNFHPKKAGYEKPVLNFAFDLKDGKDYAYLLDILAPDHCNPSMLDTKDPKERARTNSDFDAKPMVMLLGQYSTGKTTFIKHLLKSSYPGAHIGPEPTTDRFVAVMFMKVLKNQNYWNLTSGELPFPFNQCSNFLLLYQQFGPILVLFHTSSSQATAKSGASKQSSSFLKATTMTLFTISESEKSSYVDQIYSYLGDHPFLKQFLPIYPATQDLFNLVKDGVLLCKLINIVVLGGIDERAVNIRTHGIGWTVVNIRTQDLVEGRPQTWKSLET